MIERLVIDDSSAPSRQALLTDFLAEVWGRPYQLGQWDCILFIAAWADTVAGASCPSPFPGHLAPGNLSGQWRGRYRSESAALATFAPHGLNPAIATNLTARGWHEVPIRSGDTPVPSQLHPGDIILTDLHHPGIFDGAAILAQPAHSTGLLQLHQRHAVAALQWL